jgi:hypothetical protein
MPDTTYPYGYKEYTPNHVDGMYERGLVSLVERYLYHCGLQHGRDENAWLVAENEQLKAANADHQEQVEALRKRVDRAEDSLHKVARLLAARKALYEGDEILPSLVYYLGSVEQQVRTQAEYRDHWRNSYFNVVDVGVEPGHMKDIITNSYPDRRTSDAAILNG